MCGTLKIRWTSLLLVAGLVGCGTGAESLPIAEVKNTTSNVDNGNSSDQINSNQGQQVGTDASAVAGASTQVDNAEDDAVDETPVASTNVAPEPPPSAPPPPPAPLKNLPPAGRLFMRYLPDGAYKITGGIPQPTNQRDLILADLPNVAAAGFKRYATIHRMGVARSPAEAEAYYAPIVAQAQASNIKFMPGFWLLNVIDVAYGVPYEAPWNMPNTTASKQNHPMNPSALGQQAFWDAFVQVTRTLAQASQSDQVYIDCEDVFWRHQDNAFWTDENIASVRVMLRAALAELRNDGIFITIHQPRPQPNPVNLFRIAVGLFAPVGPDDALAHVEHTALAPGQRLVPGTLMTPAQVQNWYTSNGFRAEQVRFGFTEYQDIASGVFGYMPAEYHAMLEANPTIVDQSWYFAGDANSANHAVAFAAIGPPVLP